MRSALLALISATFVIWSGTAGAAEPGVMSAADLQQLCMGSDTTSRNVCRVYILGVVQGINVGLNMRGKRPCVPASIAAEDLERSIKTKLAADLAAVPDDGTRDASGIIGGIVARTYPCH